MNWTEQEYNCQRWEFIEDLVLELEKQSKKKI